MQDKILRENLLEFLQKGPAHLSVKKVLADIEVKNRHKKTHEEIHTIWEELEHLRIAQEDILRYALDATWQSPKWPDEYWPSETEDVTETQWTKSLTGFFGDLIELVNLLEDSNIKLLSEIPHGESHTYLREILLIIDHNAYHLGKIVQLRKMLNDWPF